MIKLLGQGPLYSAHKFRSRLEYEASKQRIMWYAWLMFVGILVAWIIWSGA